MNAHRSLHRTDVLKYPPHQIALMVASEFLRASSRAQYASVVGGCFERALELMGILETIPLSDEVARDMAPVYRAYRKNVLEKLMNEDAETIRNISEDVAARFDLFGRRLREPHA